MQNAKFYILFAVLAVFLIVVIQNTQLATIRFLVWRVHISLVTLILLVGLMGFAGGYVLRMVHASRKKATGGHRDTSAPTPR